MLVEGSLAGEKCFYDCPISLRLFGTSDPIERANLKARMKADRLPVEALDQREKEAKRKKVEDLKKFQDEKRAMAARARSRQQHSVGSSQFEYSGSSSQRDETPARSLEEIIGDSQRFNPREVGEFVEKFGAGEEVLSKMAMAELPEKLATKLLPYQRQALAWLVEKENPQLPPVGSKDVVQMWKRSAWDKDMFTNIATNFSLKGQAPTLASGGILAVSGILGYKCKSFFESLLAFIIRMTWVLGRPWK